MKDKENKKNVFSLNLGIKMTVFMTVISLYIGIESILIEDYLAGVFFIVMSIFTCWSYRNDMKKVEEEK